MEDDEIKEGFICPMCMKSFNLPTDLTKHFEDFHSEDKDALRQIRGMFDKAKRKILKKPGFEGDGDNNTIQQGEDGTMNDALRGLDPFLWDCQEFGKCSQLAINCCSSQTVNQSINP